MFTGQINRHRHAALRKRAVRIGCSTIQLGMIDSKNKLLMLPVVVVYKSWIASATMIAITIVR
jgi:hypothetical protein